jgi:hypothetical protein
VPAQNLLRTHPKQSLPNTSNEALQRAALIKVNVDSCQELAAYYKVTAVLTFVKVDAQSKPFAKITSAAWHEDTPAEIAPVLAKLVNTTAYDLK